jgi:putative chitinase
MTDMLKKQMQALESMMYSDDTATSTTEGLMGQGMSDSEPEDYVTSFVKYLRSKRDLDPAKAREEIPAVKARNTSITDEDIAKYEEEMSVFEQAKQSAMEARLQREASGITQSLTEEDVSVRAAVGDPEYGNKLDKDQTIMIDVTDTDEGKLSNAEPLYKMAEEIDPGTIDTDTIDADGGAAPSGKGIMSPRLDRGDDILPPKSVFINKAGTTKGDAERDLYKEAYQAGLSGDELKAFMAQVAHESGSFGTIRERGYSWSKNYNGFPQVWKDRLKRDGVTAANGTAENIFNSVYANRNGNGDYASGDGNRYRGRGYIQLTGKDNYRTIGEAIGEDLVGNPDLMSDPAIARKASIAWWKLNVRDNVPDDDYTDINAVSGLVNRGSATSTASGLNDRKKKFAKYNEKVTNSRTSPRPRLRDDEDELEVASN